MRNFLFSLSIILMLITSSFSASLTVRPDGSSDYLNIQAAIEAAAPGDTILLEDGVYSGAGNYEISFQGKDLVLRSISGNPEECIINVLGTENGINEHGFFLFNRETQMSVIQDITIKNGDADGG